ncbi:MAG: outer membrane lipoprotein chaperone LolA [Gammaproteobacteria bacterium]|nr:MAG: outer membrane lipoprotein chaperone LolA [Gammaproteobacteria bacterium]
MRAITLVFLCALAAPSLAGNGPDRLRAFLEEVRTLRAEFQQSIYDEDSRLLDDARGMVYIARPGLFRWDYAEPYLQEIVGDGDKVWIYDSDLEQVTVRPLGDALGDTPVMLLSSDEPVENRFEVRAIDGPEGFEWVGLRPLGEEVNFTEIRLAFDGDTLRVMELMDAFGQLTRLRFANVATNLELAPGLFRFTPPEGADVFSN